MLEEHMRQTSAEIGTIHINRAEFWQINFLTSGTEDLETRSLQSVAQTNGKYFLLVAQSSRAESVDT